MYGLRLVVIGLLGLILWDHSLRGQAVKGGTNVAPEPSARFPAEWYPPDNNVTSTGAPATGAPYTGIMVATATMTSPKPGEPVKTSQESFRARDGAGRRRSEEVQFRPNPDRSGTAVKQKRVMVSDPVSHCNFEWPEPWIGPEEPTATASCMPRTVHYGTDEDARDPSRKQDGEEHPFPGETLRTEHIGERIFGDVKAAGIRTTTVRTNAQTGAVQQTVSESWYSPELKEIMLFTLPVRNQDMLSYELTKVHRGEPDPALFYPPVGYKILNATDRTH